MQVGAHVSIRGGIGSAIERALGVTAELVQTHPTAAVQWRRLELDGGVARGFRHRWRESGLSEHHLHAVYLVNLATPDPVLLQRSIDSLVHYMELAEQLEATSVVLHAGSHRGAGFAARLAQVVDALGTVLERAPSSPASLLVENSAGSGGCIGCTFDELGAMVHGVASPRVGVCLDTQHLFASGYDVRTPAAARATLDRFEREVGFEWLRLVHANDSRVPLGHAADRHANIGEGEIGLRGFRSLLGDERLRTVPWLLEVPGTGDGPDVPNLERIRAASGRTAALGTVGATAVAAASPRGRAAEAPGSAPAARGPGPVRGRQPG